MWIVAFVVSGCGPSGFDPPSLVLGPRMLAIVAEPPEAAPGEDVALAPVLASAEGLELEWTVDLSTRALAASAGQYEIGDQAAPIVLARNGDGAILTGADTEAAIDALLALVAEAPPGTPEAVVRQVYETVGLTIVIEARDATGAIDAFKRVVITPRAGVTTNPPPPRFAIGGAWVNGAPECLPEIGSPAVESGTIVVLEPEPDESWLETFPALDLEGRTIEGHEDAYYSWFSTAGEFSSATTRPPDRTVEWTAPEEAGRYPIWLVVRDGHLGTSACRAEVVVR